MSLSAGVKRSQLGYMWWVLEPVLEAAVFYLVFGIFFDSAIPDFVAFLMVGLVPWTWFSRSVQNSCSSILNSKWALTHYTLHPIFFPLAEIAQDALKQALPLLVLLIFLTVYGIPPTLTWFWLPIVLIAQLILIIGIACFVASAVPLLEDLKYLVTTTLMLTMFASGIFYDPHVLLTDHWRETYFMNPVAALLEIYREVLLYASAPSPKLFLIVVTWGILFLAVTFFFVKDSRERFARLVSE